MHMHGEQRLRVLRNAGQYTADGEWQSAPVTELEIVGAVQALTPAELRVLPEGMDRSRITLRLYTRTELAPARPPGSLPPGVTGVPNGLGDRVVLGGRQFEVTDIRLDGTDRLASVGLQLGGAHWSALRHTSYLLVETADNAQLPPPPGEPAP